MKDVGSGGTERTLSDDPQFRADEAATRRASRRVRMSDPAVRAEVRRRKRRNNKIALAAVLVVVCALLAYLAVYFLPILAVREISVQGIPEEQEQTVMDAVQVAEGTPLLQVDSRKVAQRVAEIPEVSEVRVVRDYPSTLRIEIVERIPAVWMSIDGAIHVFDAEGVDFLRPDSPPEGTFELELGDTSDQFRSQSVRESVSIARALQSATATRGAEQIVTKIHSDTPQGYFLTLADGRNIEWGSAELSSEKADAFAVVMDRPGQTWNVANPAMPVSRE